MAVEIPLRSKKYPGLVALVYDYCARQLHGEFAFLNFPYLMGAAA